MEQLVIVSYDVRDDDARTRLSKRLLGFGERVQKSVFECWLDAGARAELEAVLAEALDPDTDRIRMYVVCGGCRLRTLSWGGGPAVGAVGDEPVVVIA